MWLIIIHQLADFSTVQKSEKNTPQLPQAKRTPKRKEASDRMAQRLFQLAESNKE